METRIDSITCPKCKTEQQITLWEKIIGNEDETEKKHLMDGTLFMHTCQTCQFKAPVAYNSTYVNLEKHFAIYMSADRNQEQIDKMMEEFKQTDAECANNRRVVHNVNSMREKVIIFENNLDDRIIEIIKLFYLSVLHEKQPEIVISEHYFCIVDGEWRIELLDTNGNGMVFSIEQNLYNEFKEEYKKVISETEFTYNVNASLAYDMYTRANNNK